MKAPIAASRPRRAYFLKDRGPDFGGSISYLITGDEEGDRSTAPRRCWNAWRPGAKSSTPASSASPPTPRLGEMIKIGRRGSLDGLPGGAWRAGPHSAYPHLADNPLHAPGADAAGADREPIDDGNGAFPALDAADRDSWMSATRESTSSRASPRPCSTSASPASRHSGEVVEEMGAPDAWTRPSAQ
jgi:acetylornithine deacetylase/succinyl-diaminopimelate desuccinylase-like protein